MTDKYRLRRRDEKNIVLEKFIPSKLKDDGTYTNEYWLVIGYYGKWEHAIKATLNREICPVDDSLKSQLEDILPAIERAVKKICQNIEILGKQIILNLE